MVLIILAGVQADQTFDMSMHGVAIMQLVKSMNSRHLVGCNLINISHVTISRLVLLGQNLTIPLENLKLVRINFFVCVCCSCTNVATEHLNC